MRLITVFITSPVVAFAGGKCVMLPPGHETPDTDSAVTGAALGFMGEDYVLDHGNLNVELLKNLDQVPTVGVIVFDAFPRIKGGTGFTSRVFAIAP
ncbi:MAG: hypothetical protein LBF74_10695, partial [Treponema sp.]|nr:hypothetical protein [Treponema sp.]